MASDFDSKYSFVWHEFRRQHGLSCDEYVLCDMIFYLSKNDNSEVPGWCYKSRENMAQYMGVSKQGLLNMIERMEKKGFLEKDAHTKYLRTTKKWQDVYIKKKENTTDEQQSKFRPEVNKVDHEQSTNFTGSGKETLPHINSNTDNDINKNTDVVGAVHKKLDVEIKKNYTEWTPQEFRDIVHSYKSVYSYSLLEGFYNKWKQRNPSGKMKFQCEPFWSMETRLKNWSDKQIEIDNRLKNGITQTSRPVTYFAAAGSGTNEQKQSEQKRGTSDRRIDGLSKWGNSFINRNGEQRPEDRNPDEARAD